MCTSIPNQDIWDENVQKWRIPNISNTTRIQRDQKCKGNKRLCLKTWQPKIEWLLAIHLKDAIWGIPNYWTSPHIIQVINKYILYIKYIYTIDGHISIPYSGFITQTSTSFSLYHHCNAFSHNGWSRPYSLWRVNIDRIHVCVNNSWTIFPWCAMVKTLPTRGNTHPTIIGDSLYPSNILSWLYEIPLKNQKKTSNPVFFLTNFHQSWPSPSPKKMGK